jgi:hypothetical protein
MVNGRITLDNVLSLSLVICSVQNFYVVNPTEPTLESTTFMPSYLNTVTRDIHLHRKYNVQDLLFITSSFSTAVFG